MNIRNSIDNDVKWGAKSQPLGSTSGIHCIILWTEAELYVYSGTDRQPNPNIYPYDYTGKDTQPLPKLPSLSIYNDL